LIFEKLAVIFLFTDCIENVFKIEIQRKFKIFKAYLNIFRFMKINFLNDLFQFFFFEFHLIEIQDLFFIPFLFFVWAWHLHIRLLNLKCPFMFRDQRAILIYLFQLILSECKSNSLFRFIVLLNQYLLQLFAIICVILNFKIELWPIFIVIMKYFIWKSFQSFHFFFFKLILLFFLKISSIHYRGSFLFFWAKYLSSIQQNIFHYSYRIVINIYLSIFWFLNNVLFLIFDIFW
jgi:hypothetical protein